MAVVPSYQLQQPHVFSLNEILCFNEKVSSLLRIGETKPIFSASLLQKKQKQNKSKQISFQNPYLNFYSSFETCISYS